MTNNRCIAMIHLLNYDMRKIVALLCFCILTLSIPAQNNFYVSTNGNNNNAGTFASPYKTIQYGVDQLQAGDTLNILAGTYNEKISINSSGTSNMRITVRSFQNQQVLLDGSGISTQDAMISIDDKKNINIIGLEIANNIQNDAQGIAISGGPQNITVADCKIHDIHFSSNPNETATAGKNAQGIIVYGNTTTNFPSNILINNNELFNCRLGYSEGIAVNGNINGFEISNNHVHHLTNIGIDAIGHEGTCSDPALDKARQGLIANNRVHNCLSTYATSAGIYVDGAKNIAIERNITYHNGYGIEIGCEYVGKSADSIIVRNNFIYDNEVAGIALGGYDYPSGSGKVMNSMIESNTLFMNDYNNTGSGELVVSYVETARVYNNIMYATAQNILFAIASGNTNINLDNNLYYINAGMDNMEFYFNGNTYTGLSDYQTDLNQDIHSLFAIPQFVNATLPVPDLHLQATSACINIGVSHSNNIQQTDIDGEPRFNGIIDIGADEYYMPNGIYESNTIQVNIYPNPGKAIFMLDCINLNSATVYNSLGELIGSFNTSAINLAGHADGIYIVHIKTTEGQAVKRIVKHSF